MTFENVLKTVQRSQKIYYYKNRFLLKNKKLSNHMRLESFETHSIALTIRSDLNHKSARSFSEITKWKKPHEPILFSKSKQECDKFDENTIAIKRQRPNGSNLRANSRPRRCSVRLFELNADFANTIYHLFFMVVNLWKLKVCVWIFSDFFAGPMWSCAPKMAADDARTFAMVF